MKKDCLKSVRMTQEVFNYINGFEGNGFNQKFENLVLFCMKSEEEKKSKLSFYDSLIDSRKDVLSELRNMQNLVDGMKSHLVYVSKQAEQLFKRYSDTP